MSDIIRQNLLILPLYFGWDYVIILYQREPVNLGGKVIYYRNVKGAPWDCDITHRSI